MIHQSRLINWFLELVKINTQSIFPLEQYPGNPMELKAVSYIKESLSFLKSAEFQQFDHGSLLISMEATEGFESQQILVGFLGTWENIGTKEEIFIPANFAAGGTDGGMINVLELLADILTTYIENLSS